MKFENAYKRSYFSYLVFNGYSEKKIHKKGNTEKEYAPLAQLVEQLTLNQLVPGSNP